MPDNVQGLYEDRAGRLWIGSDGGVEFYANGRFTDFTGILKLRPRRDSCWFIHEDSAGALWFGTNAGLLRLRRAGILAAVHGDNIVESRRHGRFTELIIPPGDYRAIGLECQAVKVASGDGHGR